MCSRVYVLQVPKIQLITNTKIKKGFKKKGAKETEVLLGLAHRIVFGAPERIDLKLFSFGFLRRSSAIIHRTVRCTTGLSGAPPEQRLSAHNGRLCKVNSGIQMSEQRVSGASDCPVCHRTVQCHMRTKPPTVDQLQALTVE